MKEENQFLSEDNINLRRTLSFSDSLTKSLDLTISEMKKQSKIRDEQLLLLESKYNLEHQKYLVVQEDIIKIKTKNKIYLYSAATIVVLTLIFK